MAGDGWWATVPFFLGCRATKCAVLVSTRTYAHGGRRKARRSPCTMYLHIQDRITAIAFTTIIFYKCGWRHHLHSKSSVSKYPRPLATTPAIARYNDSTRYSHQRTAELQRTGMVHSYHHFSCRGLYHYSTVRPHVQSASRATEPFVDPARWPPCGVRPAKGRLRSRAWPIAHCISAESKRDSSAIADRYCRPVYAFLYDAGRKDGDDSLFLALSRSLVLSAPNALLTTPMDMLRTAGARAQRTGQAR